MTMALQSASSQSVSLPFSRRLNNSLHVARPQSVGGLHSGIFHALALLDADQDDDAVHGLSKLAPFHAARSSPALVLTQSPVINKAADCLSF